MPTGADLTKVMYGDLAELDARVLFKLEIIFGN
jgi:hypothetical protein